MCSSVCCSGAVVDFIALIIVCRATARRLREKGYGSLYAAPAVMGYVVGEVSGVALGAAMGLGVFTYLLGMLVGVLGAMMGFAWTQRGPPRIDADEVAETFR